MSIERLKEHLKSNGHNKSEALTSPVVRDFTKQIIRAADKKDPVKAVQDIALALALLEIELDNLTIN